MNDRKCPVSRTDINDNNDGSKQHMMNIYYDILINVMQWDNFYSYYVSDDASLLFIYSQLCGVRWSVRATLR